MASFTYHFSWEPEKAGANLHKHRIRFELAATVLMDPLALSIFDADHSESEERWVTLGCAADQVLSFMKNEYDFSKAGRGKFFRKDAAADLPIYLEPEVRHYLEERAKAKGVGVDQLVNELLKRDIALMEAAK